MNFILLHYHRLELWRPTLDHLSIHVAPSPKDAAHDTPKDKCHALYQVTFTHPCPYSSFRGTGTAPTAIGNVSSMISEFEA